jgi:hypothetical protein
MGAVGHGKSRLVKNQTARTLAADEKRREKQTKERIMEKGKGQAVRVRGLSRRIRRGCE